ncbi:MAG: DUF1573 domain-containing protein [Bacteroidetes bacterium]|nr:DUF1573 domain-containing protein [Bacteroidota bacterium]
MKKVIASAFLFLGLTFAAQAQETATPNIDPNAPEIKFDQTEIDYGTIEYEGNPQREFKLKNIGKSPLVISNCQGSCGCTVPTCPKEPIMPGQSAVIKVNYDTKRVGRFDKKVTVTTNGKTPSVVLTIKGEVKPQPTPAPTTK